MAKMVLKEVPVLNTISINSDRKTFGINKILQICNIIVAFLLFLGFFQEELANHPYVDEWTLSLSLILCIQTFIVLKFEAYHPDPFVLIMAYLLIFFYELRIFTLLLYPVYTILDRYAYAPSDSNFTLLYVLVANIFLYTGFFCRKYKNIILPESINYNVKMPYGGFSIFILSLILANFPRGWISEENMQHFFDLICNNIFTPNLVLVVLSVYVFTFRNQLSSKHVLIVVIGAGLLCLLQTLSYSRSGLLTLFDTCFVFILVFLPKIRFKRISVYLFLFTMPFLLTVAINIYSISSISRSIKGDDGTTLSEKIKLFNESRNIVNNSLESDRYKAQAFSRAGYFDFSSEIIAHREQYAGIFTGTTYFKSIIDNDLTPGFDIFNQPRITSSLRYVYGNINILYRSKGEQSHSDHMGIYGEMYALFGYFSCLILFIIAYGFKKIYYHTQTQNPIKSGLIRILVLFMFYRYMNSFGLDWILWELMITSVAYITLYLIAFSAKKHGTQDSYTFTRAKLGIAK